MRGRIEIQHQTVLEGIKRAAEAERVRKASESAASVKEKENENQAGSEDQESPQT